MNNKKFSEFSIGDSACFEFDITEEVVDSFAKFSGDYNPLHTDIDYAEKTQFKERVAHGMIGACLFSRLVGMYLPGQYCLFLSQTLSFKKPIFLGTRVVVQGEIIEKVSAFNALEIKTIVQDIKTKEIFIEGRALVKLLK